MRNSSQFPRNLFAPTDFICRLCLLALIGLFCFSNNLSANVKPVTANKNRHFNNINGKTHTAAKPNRRGTFSPPTISYSTPQIYSTGTVITPLLPSSSGVAAPGYNGVASLSASLNEPNGVAVDAAGNVYVADYGNNLVKKIPVGGGAPVNIGSGFNHPTGLAVDVAGNVYVSEADNNLVKKLPFGSSTPVSIGSSLGFNQPVGLAVDAARNLYIADYGNNDVKELPVSGSPLTLYHGFFSHPQGVAVDAAGNVFVADHDDNAIKEIPLAGGGPITVISGINNPVAVALDASGNIYTISDNVLVKKFPPGGGNRCYLIQFPSSCCFSG